MKSSVDPRLLQQAQQAAMMEQEPMLPQEELSPSPSYQIQTPSQDTLIKESFESIEKTLNDLECALKGLYWNPAQRTYEKKHDPIMNNEGINSFMFFIRMHFNVNTVITNLNEKEINAIMEAISEVVCMGLAYNYQTFNIKNFSNLDIIQTTFENVIYMALKRSYNFGTFTKLSGTTHRIENLRGIEQTQQRHKFGKWI